jgi:hypothetical protein
MFFEAKVLQPISGFTGDMCQSSFAHAELAQQAAFQN